MKKIEIIRAKQRLNRFIAQKVWGADFSKEAPPTDIYECLKQRNKVNKAEVRHFNKVYQNAFKQLKKGVYIFIVFFASCASERWYVTGIDEKGEHVEWIIWNEPECVTDTLYFELKWSGDFKPTPNVTEYYVTQMKVTKLRK